MAKFFNRFRETGSRRPLARRETLVAQTPGEQGPEQWRGAAAFTDPDLSPVADAWLSTLPIAVRPFLLTVAFPQIVNQLALCWIDVATTDSLFETLLKDRHGSRDGFPDEISIELLRLHRFHEYRRPSGGMSDPFHSLVATAHPQAMADL